MEHLAQDLTIALEESESCGPTAFENDNKWRMRRRTRSAGNLYLYANKPCVYQSDESSSSASEVAGAERSKKKLASFHQSDSDEILGFSASRNCSNRNSLRMKNPIQAFLRGVSYSLESDSVNEHSPARPNLRRKRKLKRMSVDETAPIPPCGKRKRPQRLDIIDNCRSTRHSKIKPLHQSVVDKIEKLFHPANLDSDDMNNMDNQTMDLEDNCEVASESSISWSGGEGHEGDDELTDWAPPIENSSLMDHTSLNDTDPREIRAGCRRLGDERPGFSITTGANERVAKFLQDSTKSELRLYGAEHEKLGKLAALYSLDLWFEGPSSLLLRKTNKTPCMQPTQRHHSGLTAAHKRIRTHSHIIS